MPYNLKPKYAAQSDVVTLSKISKEKSAPEKSELVKRCTAVILEPEESRIHEFMNILKVIKDDRNVKEAGDQKKKYEKRAKASFFISITLIIILSSIIKFLRVLVQIIF